jgi:hypothetical protein
LCVSDYKNDLLNTNVIFLEYLSKREDSEAGVLENNKGVTDGDS